MAFGRLFRWTQARIPASELGPARGAFPAELTGPRYLNDVDREDHLAPEQRPAPPTSTGEPLFRRGNILGDIVYGAWDIVTNRALGSAGVQVVAMLRRSAPPAPTASTTIPSADTTTTPADSAVADAIRRGDPSAIEVGRQRTESAARLARIDKDIEILGTSPAGVTQQDVAARGAITMSHDMIGPEESL